MSAVNFRITLRPRSRGFHLVTDEIISQLGELPECGLLNLFVQHTSCGLTINENYDPSVRYDMNRVFNRIVPDAHPDYTHTYEGPDDMAAHLKSTITGVSLTIPIANRRLCLGTWQGIYLCEFRDAGGPRKIVATVLS